jgi:hypothetical protein
VDSADPDDSVELELEADSRALARALAAAALREAETGEPDGGGIDLVQSLHAGALAAIGNLENCDCTDREAAEASVYSSLSRYGVTIGALAELVAEVDQRSRDGLPPADGYLASPYSLPPALLDLADG